MQFVSRLIEFATNHYLLVAALLVLLVLLLLHELRKGGKSLSTRELTALVNADQAVVLDIRPAKEFASGHIVDALNIPADKLNSRMTEPGKVQGQDHHPGRRHGPALRYLGRRPEEGRLQRRQAVRRDRQLARRQPAAGEVTCRPS